MEKKSREYVKGRGSEYAVPLTAAVIQRDSGNRCEESGRIEVCDDGRRDGVDGAHPAGEGGVAGMKVGERIRAVGMHGVQQLLCGAGRNTEGMMSRCRSGSR